MDSLFILELDKTLFLCLVVYTVLAALTIGVAKYSLRSISPRQTHWGIALALMPWTICVVINPSTTIVAFATLSLIALLIAIVVFLIFFCLGVPANHTDEDENVLHLSIMPEDPVSTFLPENPK